MKSLQQRTGGGAALGMHHDLSYNVPRWLEYNSILMRRVKLHDARVRTQLCYVDIPTCGGRCLLHATGLRRLQTSEFLLNAAY